MPVYSLFPPGGNAPGANLVDLQAVAGPMFNAEISVPDVLAAYLKNMGSAIPNPVTGAALVDTGASLCCIDETIALSLGLQPVGQIPLGHAGGVRMHNRYIGKISFPGTAIPPQNFVLVGCSLSPQGILMLIGRDVLRSCVLIYNGVLGITTIAI